MIVQGAWMKPSHYADKMWLSKSAWFSPSVLETLQSSWNKNDLVRQFFTGLQILWAFYWYFDVFAWYRHGDDSCMTSQNLELIFFLDITVFLHQAVFFIYIHILRNLSRVYLTGDAHSASRGAVGHPLSVEVSLIISSHYSQTSLRTAIL